MCLHICMLIIYAGYAYFLLGIHIHIGVKIYIHADITTVIYICIPSSTFEPTYIWALVLHMGMY